MAKQGNRPAGGIGSRVNVRGPVRTGAAAKGINPGHVAQTGTALGNRAMEKQTSYRGEPKFTAGPTFGAVPLGNEVARNVGAGGVGTGRTLYGQAGTQGCHGKPDPGNPPPAGELFPGWPAMKR